MNSTLETSEKKLSTSQRRVVIKLIEKKKENDEWFIKIWRLIFLLNVDYDEIAKTLAARLKENLSKSTSGICEKQVHW